MLEKRIMEVLIILKYKYMKISLLVVILLIIIVIYPKIVISYLDLSQWNNVDNGFVLEPSEAVNVEKFIIAIESIIIHNQTIKYESYLAIDIDNLNLSENEKKYLINYFKKYNDKIILKSLKDLKKLGVYNYYLEYFLPDFYNGTVITFEEIEQITAETVEIMISKSSGSFASSGYKLTLELKNGKWQLSDLPEMQWTS